MSRAPSPATPEPNMCPSEEELTEQLCSYADLATASHTPTNATSATKAAAAPAFSSAERTAARTEGGLYADAGVDFEHLIAFAGAAALKSHDPASHIDVEALSASVQVGMQTEAQATFMKLGASSEADRTGVTATLWGAELHEGLYNPDGSIGYNLGASANYAAIEGTYQGSDWSVTAGASLGVGAEGSIGTQDRDGDGNLELCARVGVPIVGTPVGILLGGCAEKFW